MRAGVPLTLVACSNASTVACTSGPLAVFTIYLIAVGIGLGAVGLAHADLVHALLILVQALAVVVVVLILLFYERRAQPRREEP